MSKWDENTTVRFVELYREYECLWNVNSSSYRNRQIRQAALLKIVDEMAIAGFHVVEAKQKIKNLRSTYTQEIAKIEKSESSGAGTDDIYVPTLKWFHIMHSFIKTLQGKRSTVTNLNNIEQANSVTDDQEDSQQYDQNESQEDQILPNNSDEANPKRKTLTDCHANSTPKTKKSRINDVTAAVKELRKVSETLNEPQKEDEYDIFGKHVAMQLRNLSLEECLMAQQQIQSIISSCRLRDHQKSNIPSPGTFSYNHSTCMPLSSPSIASHSNASEVYSAENSITYGGDLLSQALTQAMNN